MPDNLDAIAEIERITNRLKALVAEHFGRGEERFYLSGLGILLGDDRATLEKLSKRKLADFVENVLEFELGRSGQHLNVLHIVRPVDFGPAAALNSPKPIRYAPAIWAAFATPLTDGKGRYFDVATSRFSSDPPRGGDTREIPTNLVSDGTLPASQIAENIRNWIESEGLDLSMFVAARVHRGEPRLNLLHQLLNALDQDQLKRTTLPLDVIKTLGEMPMS